jgi:hypothetical protein
MPEEQHLAADLADSGIHSDTKSSFCIGWIKKSICYLAPNVREDKFNRLKLLLAPAKATWKLAQEYKFFGLAHTQDAHEYNYIIEQPHQLCFDYVVHCDYSSPGCTGSTSTLSCVVVPLGFSSVGRTGSRRAPGHCFSRCDYSSSGLHRLYCAYVVHPDVPSRHSTSRRSHWLSPCVWSLHLAARLLVVRIASVLLRLCRAPDAPSRRSTSRRTVALALAVRPVTASCGATTCRRACTGSTAPMSCIWTHRLDARLLFSRSHWLSPCVRSFRCVS